MQRQFRVKLYFDGGEYNLPLQQMEAGQTVEIDIKKLRDNQVKDVLGNVIPLTVTGGQLDWYGRAKKGEFIGRLLEYDPVSGIASSFSCVGACPCDSGFGSAVIYPGGISGFVGDTFSLTSIENDIDCNQQAIYSFSVGGAQNLQYSSSNSNVITVSGNTATLVGAGTAQVTASWDALTMTTHCFFSAEGDCVDATCTSRTVNNPIVDDPVDSQCRTPAGETTSPVGWDSNDPTVHKWDQTLAPTGTSFVGRTVLEQDPGGGGPDTCHFSGSSFPPATSISSGNWTVSSGNHWGSDYVGWHSGAVTYYRAQGRAPCSTTFQQRMVIDCSTGPITYITNTLGGDINSTTVVSRRAGSMAIRTWP
jgi:hypothetical protein